MKHLIYLPILLIFISYCSLSPSNDSLRSLSSEKKLVNIDDIKIERIQSQDLKRKLFLGIRSKIKPMDRNLFIQSRKFYRSSRTANVRVISKNFLYLNKSYLKRAPFLNNILTDCLFGFCKSAKLINVKDSFIPDEKYDLTAYYAKHSEKPIGFLVFKIDNKIMKNLGVYILPKYRNIGVLSKFVKSIDEVSRDEVEELHFEIGDVNLAFFHKYFFSNEDNEKIYDDLIISSQKYSNLLIEFEEYRDVIEGAIHNTPAGKIIKKFNVKLKFFNFSKIPSSKKRSEEYIPEFKFQILKD